MTEQLERAGLTRRRVAPSTWSLVDATGTEVGRYGGRTGDRWAQLADGTIVTEHTRASAATVLGVLLSRLETVGH